MCESMVIISCVNLCCHN